MGEMTAVVLISFEVINPETGASQERILATVSASMLTAEQECLKRAEAMREQFLRGGLYCDWEYFACQYVKLTVHHGHSTAPKIAEYVFYWDAQPSVEVMELPVPDWETLQGLANVPNIQPAG